MRTTKLSVAPAAQPVRMERPCVISLAPAICLNLFPQKSLAATNVKEWHQ